MRPTSNCLLFLLLLNSCRLDTEALTTVDTLARDIPNIVIEQVIYKEIENSKLVQEVYADEFRVFSQQNIVQVEQGRVRTYSNGKERLEGKAASAQYNQETEDAEATGPIEVYYYPEKTRITAPKLNWVRQERRLSSTAEGVVEVEQDNGTQFRGKDFSIDMATMSVAYEKDVAGELYASTEGAPEERLAAEGAESQ